MPSPLLLVICGPTASGKTALSVQLAKHYHTEILSSDSRQFYRGLDIGTAKPTPAEQQGIPHHFIDSLNLDDEYNIGRYETDALACLDKLFLTKPIAILAGGSGLYMQAVCEGMDPLPASDPELRQKLNQLLAEGGIGIIQEKLKSLDPEYYSSVDLSNPHRLVRAVEVCLLSGKKYSELRQGKKAVRDFRVLRIGLQPDRDVLYKTIDARVDVMMAKGLEEEARRHYPHRKLPALNTVGYKELFDFFDGKTDRDQAVALIKQHTRNYARRQMTWLRQYTDIQWYKPGEFEKICSAVNRALGHNS